MIERDRKRPIPETSYVVPGPKPDKKFTLVMEEGDLVELSVQNKGSMPHGVSLHAVYSQTSKYYGKINPGDCSKVPAEDQLC